MKIVQAANGGHANYSTHKDEADQACKIIVEIDALWRMSYGYGVGLDSRGGMTSQLLLPHDAGQFLSGRFDPFLTGSSASSEDTTIQ
jgi:hypothetical protein